MADRVREGGGGGGRGGGGRGGRGGKGERGVWSGGGPGWGAFRVEGSPGGAKNSRVFPFPDFFYIFMKLFRFFRGLLSVVWAF